MNEIVKRSQRGESAALDELITAVQPKIYGLALRMLWHPEDAKDATQEILLRVVRHLAAFRGNSGFLTWAYRVAANHFPLCRRNTRFRAAPSSLNEVKGICADTTRNPSASSLVATLFQLEPSAQAA